ncbi:MAG: HEAT repeat protein, partial [Ilumatobacter sp.]
MTGPTRRDVAVAGHQGDIDTAIAGLTTDDGSIRATALGALERLGELTDEQLITAFGDDDPRVRRRAAELAATHPLVDLVSLLADPDVNVVEMAAWTTGEHESNRPAVLDRLLELAQSAEEPLVREASVAALGAIGDPAAVDVIIAACSDKPAVRR